MLRPRVAVPIHYAYTAGPVRDRLLLRYDGTADRFGAALRAAAATTQAKILEPGEPLTVNGTATRQPPPLPRR